jgi:hypothetical protein
VKGYAQRLAKKEAIKRKEISSSEAKKSRIWIRWGRSFQPLMLLSGLASMPIRSLNLQAQIERLQAQAAPAAQLQA